MPDFKYENLALNTTDWNKCYVGYTIIREDGSRERRKEYGKSQYNISIQKGKDNSEKKDIGNLLLLAVKNDLDEGVDPRNSKISRDIKNLAKLALEKKLEDSKISIDDAIQMTREEKGWINPAETKEHSAGKITTFLKNQLKPYFEEIGKNEDVRDVTRNDIKNFIEAHFNPQLDSGDNEWSSASCSVYRGWMGILFSVLLEKDLINVNPTAGIKIKSDSEKILMKEDDEDLDRFEPWTDQELHIWFDENRTGTSIERMMYTTSCVLHYAFIRKTEILRMRIWMCDFENKKFTLPPKITKSARKYSTKNLLDVFMQEELITALKDWIDFKFPNGYDDDDYLFPNFKGNKIPCPYSTFTRRFVTVREKLQNKHAGLFINKNQYALKHTGVQKMFKSLSKLHLSPNDIQTMISQQCRHSNFNQTETYLRRLKLESQGERVIYKF